MTITKLQQSGFILRSASGFNLAIDIAVMTPLDSLDAILETSGKIDSMLISHMHTDHFSVDHIKKINPQTLYINQECKDLLKDASLDSEISTIKAGSKVTIGPFEMEVFAVDHGPNISKPVENTGFLIEAEGESFYFAGDMFNPVPNASKIEVTKAMIPVGGFYTFDPEAAYAFAKTFKKVGTVIPMHDRGEPEHTDKFIEIASKDFTVERM